MPWCGKVNGAAWHLLTERTAQLLSGLQADAGSITQRGMRTSRIQAVVEATEQASALQGCRTEMSVPATASRWCLKTEHASVVQGPESRWDSTPASPSRWCPTPLQDGQTTLGHWCAFQLCLDGGLEVSGRSASHAASTKPHAHGGFVGL